MEYYNGILCASATDLEPIVGRNTLQSLITRGKCQRVRRACYEQAALYAVDSLPSKYKKMLYEMNGEIATEEGRRLMREEGGLLRRAIEPDAQAQNWFAAYRKPNGEMLTAEKQRELTNNCIILNACRKLLENSRSLHIRQGKGNAQVRKKDFWAGVANALPRLMADYPHSLPMNARRLQQKYEQYTQQGFAAFISGLIGNQNKQAITAPMVKLILSIYGTKDKPFASDVLSIYKDFMLGVVDVVNTETGELFNRNEFYKNGFPVMPSETSIWNIINDPENRRIVDLRRNDTMYNRAKHTPHHVRYAPTYTLSKISMDDRDLTRKTTMRERVCAYYAYDVVSGCCIGASYSLQKNVDLVRDCFRDMFLFLDKNGLGCPLEVEVEHHLMEQIKDDLQLMFQHVRFCAAGNSQEKRAEHLNKAKKYTAEKQLGQTTGRWWARSEAYRQPNEREYNKQVMAGEINAYKEVLLPYDQLVKEDREAIEAFNNQLHPDQKRFAGKTRLQVFFENINPEIKALNKPVIWRLIGERTETTLRRSEYVTVQYGKYRLPSPECIKLLKPNNYSVEAYWLKDAEGEIKTVELYQGDKFIASCKQIVAYNESEAERTDADRAALLEQEKYVSKYYKMVKDAKAEKLSRVKVVPAVVVEEAISNQQSANGNQQLTENTRTPAESEMLDEWTVEDWIAKAIGEL